MILHGDCLEILLELPDHFDSIVCDPPYGMEFMNADWDKEVPGPDYWLAAWYAAKPGAYLLAMGGTRTHHRLACAIEDAGWEIRDCLMWLYGQGFPKSLNVSKAIDKAAGAERPIIGTQRLTGNACVPTKDKGGTYGVGVGTVPPQDVPITGPATPEAEQWDGWGTALKPAWEPIIMARKPFKGTAAQNVLSHGTGALNIDGCRVEGIAEKPGGKIRSKRGKFQSENDSGFSMIDAPDPNPLGRWPANVIMDEEAGGMLDEQSGERPGMSGGGKHKALPDDQGVTAMDRVRRAVAQVDQGMFGAIDGNESHIRADTGGASRFFYCPKAGRKEREAGLDDFEAGTVDDGRGKAVDNAFQRGKTVRKNRHPTVKPIALMRYLVRMVTPPGGTVLDPFCGSGSTGCAAVLEDRDFVGIDIDPYYIALAEARITHTEGTRK